MHVGDRADGYPAAIRRPMQEIDTIDRNTVVLRPLMQTTDIDGRRAVANIHLIQGAI